MRSHRVTRSSATHLRDERLESRLFRRLRLALRAGSSADVNETPVGVRPRGPAISFYDMRRVLVIVGTAIVMGLAIVAMVLRPNVKPKPWKTADVWYHESDVAQIGRTGHPQLVEFFHPD